MSPLNGKLLLHQTLTHIRLKYTSNNDCRDVKFCARKCSDECHMSTLMTTDFYISEEIVDL